LLIFIASFIPGKLYSSFVRKLGSSYDPSALVGSFCWLSIPSLGEILEHLFTSLHAYCCRHSLLALPKTDNIV